jgi:hypothetical protein
MYGIDPASPLFPSIAMLGAFACVIGGIALIRRQERCKGALMLVMAVVLVTNVLIWTL